MKEKLCQPITLASHMSEECKYVLFMFKSPESQLPLLCLWVWKCCVWHLIWRMFLLIPASFQQVEFVICGLRPKPRPGKSETQDCWVWRSNNNIISLTQCPEAFISSSELFIISSFVAIGLHSFPPYNVCWNGKLHERYTFARAYLVQRM